LYNSARTALEALRNAFCESSTYLLSYSAVAEGPRDALCQFESRQLLYVKAKFHYASWFGAGSELV